MNRLRQEIERCMLGMDVESDGRARARFVFPPDFLGFQGHFPENPVLPGICKIQAALAVCRAARKEPVRLLEVISAKFVMPVTANEELTVECRQTETDNGRHRVAARFRRNGKQVAKIDLLIVGDMAGAKP